MILLQLFLVSVSSLSVILEQKPTCFFVKTYEENTTLTVNYLISGLDETKSEFFIESEAQEVLIWIEGEKEKVLKQVLENKGTYYLCFQSKDKSYKMVSFDFDLEGIDKNYAQSDQFDQLNKKLQDTSRNFQSIYRNQHWQSDRENAHALSIYRYIHSFGINRKISIMVCFYQDFSFNIDQWHTNICCLYLLQRQIIWPQCVMYFINKIKMQNIPASHKNDLLLNVVDQAMESLLQFLNQSQLHLQSDKEFQLQFKKMLLQQQSSASESEDMNELELYVKCKHRSQRHPSFKVFNPLKYLAQEIRKQQQ